MTNVESGTPGPQTDETKQSETLVNGRDVEEFTTHSYRPSRWQSNITIISCVSRRINIVDAFLLLTSLVYRQLQRWLPKYPCQSYQCHLQAGARL
jgi:hypothetical protein